MDDQAESIYREFKAVLGAQAKIVVYKHRGDDLTWFLPEMTPRQEHSVDRYLTSLAQVHHRYGLPGSTRLFKAHYSGIVPVEGSYHEARARALRTARRLMKQGATTESTRVRQRPHFVGRAALVTPL